MDRKLSCIALICAEIEFFGLIPTHLSVAWYVSLLSLVTFEHPA